MQTTLSYQHQLNTIRALTDYLIFFAHDHLTYNTSVLEENYSTLMRRKKKKEDLNSTSMDQYSPFSKFLIFKPNTSLTDLLLASVYHLALKKKK